MYTQIEAAVSITVNFPMLVLVVSVISRPQEKQERPPGLAKNKAKQQAQMYV